MRHAPAQLYFLELSASRAIRFLNGLNGLRMQAQLFTRPLAIGLHRVGAKEFTFTLPVCVRKLIAIVPDKIHRTRLLAQKSPVLVFQAQAQGSGGEFSAGYAISIALFSPYIPGLKAEVLRRSG